MDIATSRRELIELSRRAIKTRNLNSAELSGDFLNGFSEGIAEFLALLLPAGESASDLLEEIEHD